MARVAFSVRFPSHLAESLDWLTTKNRTSRSDLVQAILGAIEESDRDQILKTAAEGAATERRNLRLSADSLARLRQLAGDLRPSDFLRRMIAYVVQMLPPQERHQMESPGSSPRATSSRARRLHGRRTAGEDVDLTAANGPQIGLLIVPVLLAIGALISLIVWLLCRQSAPSPPGPGDDARGQLADGSPEEPTA